MKASSVWMMRTARTFGEIEYNALQMDRGAALNCHILHNWAELENKGIDPVETAQGFPDRFACSWPNRQGTQADC